MRCSVAAVLLSLCPLVGWAQSVPTIAFDSVPYLLKLPKDMHLGEMAGVAVNKQGHIFAYSRGNVTGPAFGATAAQLLEFDANGKYLREIGKNNYAAAYAHVVRIDPQGSIWTIDKGSDMIVKYSPQGRVQ